MKDRLIYNVPLSDKVRKRKEYSEQEEEDWEFFQRYKDLEYTVKTGVWVEVVKSGAVG